MEFLGEISLSVKLSALDWQLIKTCVQFTDCFFITSQIVLSKCFIKGRGCRVLYLRKALRFCHEAI